MTTVAIEDKNVQTKMSLKEVCAECNAVSVETFFNELNSRIEKWDDNEKK